MPPPELKVTSISTARAPWMGEPSGRWLGHGVTDRNVAGTPSEIDRGLCHRSFDGGVHTPVAREQCAGLAHAFVLKPPTALETMHAASDMRTNAFFISTSERRVVMCFGLASGQNQTLVT
jgi:hypothetical protein